MYNHYNHYNHNITTITTTTTTTTGLNDGYYKRIKFRYAGLNYCKAKNLWNLERIRDTLKAPINNNAVSVCVVMLLYFYD